MAYRRTTARRSTGRRSYGVKSRASRGRARRSTGRSRASGGTMRLVVEVQNASPVSRNLNPVSIAGALPKKAKF